MTGGDKFCVKYLRPFKKAKPLDFFIADHAGVWCSSSKIVIMKIVDDIIPELASEVQRKDRDLKIGMVADNEWRCLYRRSIIKGVEHFDVQARHLIALLDEQACGNGRVNAARNADKNFFLYALQQERNHGLCQW